MYEYVKCVTEAVGGRLWSRAQGSMEAVMKAAISDLLYHILMFNEAL